MKFLENRIPPPILVLAFGAAMWPLAQLPPKLPLDHGPRLALAIGLAALALLALFSGLLAFRKARTTIDPVNIQRASSLVQSGVYRLTRNPMYVGFAGLLLGWAILLTGAWALLGPIAFVAYITRFQILPEERAMLHRFGAAYAVYRSRTRRWI